MDLKKIYLFSNLTEKELEKLNRISIKKSFKKNEIIFYEGDKAKYLHILLSGVVKAYKSNYHNEVLISYFYPITMIAEVANLENIHFPATARFEEDGELLLIDYSKFKEEFLSNPQISFNFILSLTKKVKILERVIANSLTMNSIAKVSKFIYENEEIFLSLKQAKIANILNMKPETLSRALKKLKDKNIKLYR